MRKKRIKSLKDASFKEILAFSLLPFGLLTISTIIGTAYNIFLTDVIKLTPAAVGIVLSGTKIWDAVNDPMMGYIVDKTRTKYGKCRPYLIWAVIPVVLATAMLFAPINFGQLGNTIYCIIAYIVYYTAYTAIDIPYQGLTPLVFPENDKRVKAISFSNILASVGTIVPQVLFFVFVGMFGSGNEKQGFFITALLLSVTAGIFIAASFFGIKEKVYIPPKKTPFFEGLKIVFKDRKMIILTIAAFMTALINVGPGMFLAYFGKWNSINALEEPLRIFSAWLSNLLNANIQISSIMIAPTILSIGSGISWMLSMAFIPPLLKRMDKKTLWIWMSFIGAAANLLTYIIGVYIFPYTTLSGFIILILLRFFTNFPMGMSMVLLIAMFSDVIDNMEMETGGRLEGTVFSFKSLVNKVVIAACNVSLLTLLGVIGYNAANMEALTDGATKPLITSPTIPAIVDGVNYTSVLNFLFFTMTGFCAIGLVLQAIPMFFYKFDEKTQEAKLLEFRAQKELALQEEIQAALEAEHSNSVVTVVSENMAIIEPSYDNEYDENDTDNEKNENNI